MQYTIESLAHNGIRDIVLVVGYRKEHIFDYMGSGEQFGIEIKYIKQEKQLGAANAITQAKPVDDDEVMVMPGDKLIESDTISKFKDAKPEEMVVK